MEYAGRKAVAVVSGCQGNQSAPYIPAACNNTLSQQQRSAAFQQIATLLAASRTVLWVLHSDHRQVVKHEGQLVVGVGANTQLPHLHLHPLHARGAAAGN